MSVNLRLVQLSGGKYDFYVFLRLRVGFPLRFVFAILRSSLWLIELAIWRDAPLSDDFDSCRVLPQAQRQLPFAVSLILQAYINNSGPRLNRTGISRAASLQSQSILSC